jgi:cell fate (sporulation/competence/biofilm development) regulator YmcA (YheA/YmcA/DUF963 family)
VAVSQADEDRIKELQRLAVELGKNGDTEVAEQVTALGQAMEKQINEEGK